MCDNVITLAFLSIQIKMVVLDMNRRVSHLFVSGINFFAYFVAVSYCFMSFHGLSQFWHWDTQYICTTQIGSI